MMHSLIKLIICLALSMPFAYAKVTQESSERELIQLKANISKINVWLDRANTEKTGLSKALEKQEKRIDQLSRDIRHNQAKIRRHTKELAGLELDLKQQTRALNTQKEFLIKQLQRAYLHGETSQAKILLNSDNPQELARDLKFFSYINDARQEKINAFQKIISDIKKTEAQILSQKKQLHDQQGLLEGNRTRIKAEQKTRKQVLAKLQANIKNENQRLDKMRHDQKRLEKLIHELESAVANLSLPDDALPFHKLKRKLPWPVRGKILARFGSKLANGKLKLRGIQLASKDNQEVKAVHAGRVIFSNWIRGFGLLIIVDHGNNYMSLYGNNKSLAKETGDWVRRGEILSYASQSSTKGETGLYFEIRKDGKPLNPAHWLQK